MINKIIKIVELEKALLEELLKIVQKQQVALVKLKISELAELSNYQEEISKKIRSLELSRLNMVASFLGITRSEASSITMSELSRYVNHNEGVQLLKYRDEMKEIHTRLYNGLLTNRLLANRAKVSFSNILSLVTNGTNQIYNVKV
jgi:hypothetical protein